MPQLPFSTVEILLIDEMGKEISGTGIDTNIVGRKEAGDAREQPRVKLIVVRRLSKATHENACGIGLTDFVTQCVMDEVDLEATWINCLAAGHLAAGNLPIYRHTNRDTLDLAISQIGLIDPPDARILWISNTKKLVEIECSAAYFEAARDRDDLEILCNLRPLPFDEAGSLPDILSSHLSV